MSNGEGQSNPPQNPFTELTRFQANAIVTPEAYERSMAQLQQARLTLAHIEQQHKQGLMMYYEREQLETMVEQGRLAA